LKFWRTTSPVLTIVNPKITNIDVFR
jgi:hypothetical protein